MLQTLHRVEGALVVTIPEDFVHQNGLTEGTKVELHLAGKRMTIEVRSRPRYKAADLMAEIPEGLPQAEGWGEMPSPATGVKSMRKLWRFAESQENIDRLATRLGVCIAVFGALLAIATVAAMIAK
ncbi:AbrB/MazE/SpoVT family DNA-binding domain-containing protein [Cupriavidus necator]|uniref:AbrB/MazE/SpoVT family DNA-binding domain-containing protein n=1 Tax=Cupriavidus necator TaxID=106590 RepID=UPI0019D23A19|nr:hypothetical protein [Cupriavidus necator]